MTTEKKKMIAVILAAVLVAGVVFSAAASLVTVRAVNELKSAAGLTSGQTQEDDVPIMNGEFWIRSTRNISDAYRSGSTSGLSDKDQETLEMASAVLDEIITENMTPYEKENPDCINGSRRQRIAKGSGTSIAEVNKLLKQFEQTKKMMKMAVDGSLMQKLKGFRH